MRCVSVRRTNLSIAGPGKARVLCPSTINAPNQPICSARYAPSAEPALPSRCPLATPRPLQLHLDEIATKVTPGALAVLFSIKLDGTAPKISEAPKNISLLPLPPRAPGELNPQNGSLCGRAGCRTASSNPSTKSSTRYAWNALIDQPWKIMSIARRDWAVADHSL